MSRHVLNTYTAERPCESCRHNVSKYRWDFLGLHTCWNCGDLDEPNITGHQMRVLVAHTDAVHVADRRRKRRTRAAMND